MQNIRRIQALSLVVVVVFVATHCASTQQEKKAKIPEKQPVEAQPRLADMSVDELRQEVRAYVDERIREYEAQSKQGGKTRDTGDDDRNARPRIARDELVLRGRELVKQLRQRVQVDLMARIEQDFGASATPQTEAIPLEAVDKNGDVVEVEVPVETRELRRLTLPSNRAKMHALVGEEDLTLALYTDVPSPIVPAEAKEFMRTYEDEAASAIAMEARLIVTLKGGEWVDSSGSERVANAIAIRGLDLVEGLQENSNQRYDDTMFVILEDANGEFEVYEYRMTTESSSTKKGVGRLDSKQVTYVRGLHRGKDPGYRLKGGSADGTRVEMEGDYKITGANIHSAYAKRAITSDTPLKANVSLGCQVVAAGKTPFEKSLVFLLDKKGVKQFPYTIVEDEEIAFLDKSLQEKGKESLLVHAITREM